MPTAFYRRHSKALTAEHSRAQLRQVGQPVQDDFVDTMPQWFRSEAFAEDVAEQALHADGQALGQRAGSLVAIDRRVLAAGAAVVRQTLRAFKQQRW
jgi:hypothetical protein